MLEASEVPVHHIEAHPSNCQSLYINNAFLAYDSDILKATVKPPKLSSNGTKKKRSYSDVSFDTNSAEENDYAHLSKSSQFTVTQKNPVAISERWITIANTCFSSSIPIPINMTEDLVERLAQKGTDEMDITIDRCTFKTTNKKKYDISVSFGKFLSLFHIDIPSNYKALVEAQCRFFRGQVVSTKTDHHRVNKPILQLHLKKSDNDSLDYQGAPIPIAQVTYRLNFQIDIRESVLYPYSIDAIRKVRTLNSLVFENDLTDYQKGVTGVPTTTHIKNPNERMFYDLVTSNTELNLFNKDSKPFHLPQLRSKTLLGFQKESLDWMLRKEGVKLVELDDETDLDNDEKVMAKAIPFFNPKNLDPDSDNISKCLDIVSFGWTRIKRHNFTHTNQDNNDDATMYYYYNQYTGNMCSKESAIEFLSKANHPPAQGLLAEEMGLGKTVEVISLILSNPRTQLRGIHDLKTDAFNQRPIMECKSTLIICPESIVGQWKQEIEDSGSALKVIVYNGIYNYEKLAENRSIRLSPTAIAQKLSEYDVILVSYGVVSREVHRATYNSVSRPSRECTKRIRFPMFEDSDRQFDPLEADRKKTQSKSRGRRRRELDSDDEDDETLIQANEQKNRGNEFDDDDEEVYEDDGDNYEYHKRDYSSPLMLLEFWRVVLDEVQMTSSVKTNASKIARMIPRVHAWGVSGTLIKKDLNDLYSLLSFLRLYPIDIFSPVSLDSAWKKIMNEPELYQFQRLVKSICLRHTKQMVSEQIQIPPQVRILLKTPFTAIERDNYNHSLNQFLSQVGLNEFGEPVHEDWDPSRVYTNMRSWLTKLRRLCCHAQIGSGNIRKRRGIHANGDKKDGSDVDDISTLSDVLFNVQQNAIDDIYQNQRSYLALKLKQGKIHEFLRMPNVAVDVFQECIKEIKELMEKIADDDLSNEQKKMARIRGWNELLYQAYFLCASAHFQHYRPMAPLQESMDETFEDEGRETVEQIDVTTLSEEEKKHYDKENEYYSLADSILTQLLQEPLGKVNEMIEKLTKKFSSIEVYQVDIKHETLGELNGEEEYKKEKVDAYLIIPLIESFDEVIEKHGIHLGKIRLFMEQLSKSRDMFNKNANLINHWIYKVVELLRKPVTNDTNDTSNASNDSQEAGNEYSASLDYQHEIGVYLDMISIMLQERETLMVAVESSAIERAKQMIEGDLKTRQLEYQNTDSATLFLKLQEDRKAVVKLESFDTDYSLRSLIRSFTALEVECKRYETTSSVYSTDYEFLTSSSELFKKDFKTQEKSFSALKKIVSELLNDVFNAKVEYFKSLQKRSDDVQKYSPPSYMNAMYDLSTRAQNDLNATRDMCKRLTDSCNTNMMRMKYLKSLLATDDGKSEEDDDAEKDRKCVICVSTITLGVLTSCGHQYCKDCLEYWFQSRSRADCPICKRPLEKKDMYSFVYERPELRGGLLTEEDSHDNSHEHAESQPASSPLPAAKKSEITLYKPLKEDVLTEIQDIKLVKDYGTKLDMILRQVIWIKENEKDPQILIYSQWTDFLRLISIALKQNGIKCLGSRDTLSGENSYGRKRQTKKYVDDFRNDPTITCFLLNAKAQAAGLTLVNASHVFLCESLVSLPLQLQAISRVHRLGQVKKTTVWMFVIEDTVDESIAILSGKKRIELLKKHKKDVNDPRGAIEDVAGDEGEIDDVDDESKDNVIDSTELTKISADLVEKKLEGGELVSNDDLWSSFFSHTVNAVRRNATNNDGNDNREAMQERLQAEGENGIYDSNFVSGEDNVAVAT